MSFHDHKQTRIYYKYNISEHESALIVFTMAYSKPPNKTLQKCDYNLSNKKSDVKL